LVDPLTIGEKSRCLYSSFLKSAFLQGEVRVVNKDSVVLFDEKEIMYDILIVATGSSYVSFPIGKPSSQISLRERNSYFISENARLVSAREILIIGGGPVGVELAGEIASKDQNKNICLVHGNDRLLNFMNPKAGKKALQQLHDLKVTVVLNEKLEADGQDQYRSSISGKVYKADVIYNCAGTSVNTAFMREKFIDSMDERGLLRVDNTFLVRNTENIYAIGDCAAINEAKLGTFANAHGEFLAKHLIALSRNKKTSTYAPQKTMALVPIGREKGVVQLPFGILTNKFLIKIKTKDFFIDKYRNLLGIK
jgi:apoptosis-inducing factor 2